MEGMEIITNLISNLGFPIAMCIILFYSLNQERKDHKASEDVINRSIVELKETFTQTIHGQINRSIIELKETFMQTIHGQQEKMVEAINNNTLVMQRLVDKLGKEG